MSSNLCSVDVCERHVVARNYCQAHYYWARRRGFEVSPTHKIGSLVVDECPQVCVAEECERQEVVARGYCRTHYQRAWKNDCFGEVSGASRSDFQLDVSGWTRDNILWLSGLLEGEGWFSLAKNGSGRKYPVVGVKMTDRDVVCKVKEIMGGRLDVRRRDMGDDVKDQYQFTVHRSNFIYAICMAVYPFMGERRQLQIRKVVGRCLEIM